MITFIDLFAGIGGFRIALEKCGCQCVFSSEIDIHCQKVYFNNFGEKPFGDITKIDENTIPAFDILCAGIPCQPFSICGKKQGFEDTRGTLFWDVCRIIKAKSPKVILIENVKHLINHNKKQTIKTMISSLEELGYCVSYEILNAKDFGVPQNRERVFIIGIKNKKFDFSDVRKRIPIFLKDILDVKGNFEYLDKNDYTLIDNKYVHIQPTGLLFVGYRNKNIWKKGVRENTLHLSRVHRQPNRIYSIDGVHPTIPSQEVSGRFWIYLPNEDKVRKLTILECYKLFGFPQNFIRDTNISRQYRQIGNSVVIPVIYELVQSIIRQVF